MAETIKPYLGQDVLEIGAGMGNLTRCLSGRRRRYIATDIENDHLDRLPSRFRHRPNTEIERVDLTHGPAFKPFAGTMDTVVCLNVLEHVEDHLGALRNMHLALRPGGCAIVLVPHGPELFGRMDEKLGHYRRYSHAQLSQVLEAAGFTIERLLEFNRISRPGWYLNGKVLKRCQISRLQLRLFDSLVSLWRLVDRVLPWGPTSIIAIARKAAASSSNKADGCLIGSTTWLDDGVQRQSKPCGRKRELICMLEVEGLNAVSVPGRDLSSILGQHSRTSRKFAQELRFSQHRCFRPPSELLRMRSKRVT